jgi:preprotein translocase subunit SecA
MVRHWNQILTQSLDSAQERVEERAYQQRKNLFDYDDILNKEILFITKDDKF